MEIIAEIIFAIFGGIIEFIFSAVFQAIAELLGFTGEIFAARRKKNAATHEAPENAIRSRRIAAGFNLFFWALGGVCAGGVSLVISPNLHLPSGWQRYANLVLMPLICGTLSQIIHNWLDGGDREPPAVSPFIHGFVFALAMTIIRFSFGK